MSDHMTEFPCNPFEPIRIPAGPEGDAILEWLAKIYGTTVEEARERGRRASQQVYHLSKVVPKPLKAPVGAIFALQYDRSEMLKGLEEKDDGES